MKKAGYKESYRKSILKSALNIYEMKWEQDRLGTRPVFRPKNWKREERAREKVRKRRSWATRKGHIAPIFVPATPGGVLAKEMKKVADREASEGIHFNIVEMGGNRLKAELQKSNPTATPGCNKVDCMGCSVGRGKGGRCHRNNVNYMVECLLCPENQRAMYVGETSRNLYTRTQEHYNNKDKESFMNKHMKEYHTGQERMFKARVTHTNKDCLTRQVREGVMIRRTPGTLLNNKTEWFQPPLYRVRNEIIRE